MKVEARVSVKVGGVKAIVRKVERDADGQFVAKYGLTSEGEWVKVPDGEIYPAECRLPFRRMV